MGEGKSPKISRLVAGKKPQLARRHERLHAICMISKITMFFNSLFYNVFILFSDLARRLQYPC